MANLGPTAVVSFGRGGFLKHAASFQPEDLDVTLHGERHVVTGANSGIGRETALELASRGAEVWMLCRSQERGEAAREELAAEPRVREGGGELHLVQCDVSDLESVDRALDALPDRIHALVHNAGALLDERRLSPQKVEMTLATHLVGPLRMTAGLLGRLRNSDASGRVIWVSSGGMYTRRLNVKRLTSVSGTFNGVNAYADVKRAQVVVNEQLAARLRGSGIVSNAMHPGWAGTRGVVESLPRFYKATQNILRDASQGADTVVWLAACRSIGRETGGFWFDRAEAPTHLLPFTRASDAERARLWDSAHEWAGLDDDVWEL